MITEAIIKRDNNTTVSFTDFRNRNILYTAITRAKSLVVLVGVQSQLDGMIKNVSNAERNSGLTFMFELVKEAFGK